MLVIFCLLCYTGAVYFSQILTTDPLFSIRSCRRSLSFLSIIGKMPPEAKKYPIRGINLPPLSPLSPAVEVMDWWRYCHLHRGYCSPPLTRDTVPLTTDRYCPSPPPGYCPPHIIELFLAKLFLCTHSNAPPFTSALRALKAKSSQY